MEKVLWRLSKHIHSLQPILVVGGPREITRLFAAYPSSHMLLHPTLIVEAQAGFSSGQMEVYGQGKKPCTHNYRTPLVSCYNNNLYT